MSPVGLVLAAHGELAGQLVDSARMIVGDQVPIQTVHLDMDTNLDGLCTCMLDAVDAAEQGAGVLILIDLFGGTPSNAAAMCLQQRHCGVVSGVNLPMLLEVLMAIEQGQGLDDLSHTALQAGLSGIIDVRERLQSRISKEQNGDE
jgi:PTS system mannose-specific IIA component